MRLCRLFPVVALLVVAALPAVAARRMPPTVELDGCILPSTSCTRTSDVVEMVIADEKVDFAVETLRFVTSTNASSGKVLAELRFRPLRVHGPEELVRKLAPGGRWRIRGTLRLPPGYLLLQAVEPLPGKE